MEGSSQLRTLYTCPCGGASPHGSVHPNRRLQRDLSYQVNSGPRGGKEVPGRPALSRRALCEVDNYKRIPWWEFCGRLQTFSSPRTFPLRPRRPRSGRVGTEKRMSPWGLSPATSLPAASLSPPRESSRSRPYSPDGTGGRGGGSRKEGIEG